MQTLRPVGLWLLVSALLLGCSAGQSTAGQIVPPVRTGAATAAAKGFPQLQGKRVGLVTNHTAMVDSVHLIDVIHRAPGVDLVALFGPEHGLRGLAADGEIVDDEVDRATGLPVYSLYGERRRPPVDVLRELDVLVFDIQDIGARFYTYISTMGLAMQAASEAQIEFIVMDRPNPLGGIYVSGHVTEERFESFVGQYPIPITHGMTVGELALMIKGERYMEGLEDLSLTVVEVEGWSRSDLWPDTGLPWVPTSPNIPDFETALVYPGACLFEGTSISEGRGTMEPFLVIGGPDIDGADLASEMNARGLPGVTFEPVSFTPVHIPGKASNPKYQGSLLGGVRHVITDAETFLPVETGVQLLHAIYHASPETRRSELLDAGRINARAGSDRLLELMTSGADADAIIGSWSAEVEAFRQQRLPYLLYEGRGE